MMEQAPVSTPIKRLWRVGLLARDLAGVRLRRKGKGADDARRRLVERLGSLHGLPQKIGQLLALAGPDGPSSFAPLTESRSALPLRDGARSAGSLARPPVDRLLPLDRRRGHRRLAGAGPPRRPAGRAAGGRQDPVPRQRGQRRRRPRYPGLALAPLRRPARRVRPGGLPARDRRHAAAGARLPPGGPVPPAIRRTRRGVRGGRRPRGHRRAVHRPRPHHDLAGRGAVRSGANLARGGPAAGGPRPVAAVPHERLRLALPARRPAPRQLPLPAATATASAWACSISAVSCRWTRTARRPSSDWSRGLRRRPSIRSWRIIWRSASTRTCWSRWPTCSPRSTRSCSSRSSRRGLSRSRPGG